MPETTFRAAEFFAGIGLVRIALEKAGIKVAWANDIEACKYAMYESQFGARSSCHYLLGDVRDVRGIDLPDVDVATASFPCTDLSLAGKREGLAGEQSGMFWEFARVITEMEASRPKVIMLENVPGFATSNGGDDLARAIATLNDLGYVCDVFTVDASLFVPQSRLRMFIVGTLGRVAADLWEPTPFRPPWVAKYFAEHPGMEVQFMDLPPIEPAPFSLADVVERLPKTSPLWWDDDRRRRFMDTLGAGHHERLLAVQRLGGPSWRTAYRRTRHGRCVWEVRDDDMAGCLRTARGGSSRQAIVEIQRSGIRARWMTPREYAGLQGAAEFVLDGTVSDNKALFGFGDGVCVPVIEWIAKHYLRPAIEACAATAIHA